MTGLRKNLPWIIALTLVAGCGKSASESSEQPAAAAATPEPGTAVAQEKGAAAPTTSAAAPATPPASEGSAAPDPAPEPTADANTARAMALLAQIAAGEFDANVALDPSSELAFVGLSKHSAKPLRGAVSICSAKERAAFIKSLEWISETIDDSLSEKKTSCVADGPQHVRCTVVPANDELESTVSIWMETHEVLGEAQLRGIAVHDRFAKDADSIGKAVWGDLSKAYGRGCGAGDSGGPH